MEAHDRDPAIRNERPAYRVPLGMPIKADAKREGAIISLVVHLGIILLLLFPVLIARTVIEKIQQGAGGKGPAGGGGGGRMGNDGAVETLRFVRVSPQPVPTPAVIPPKPTPIVPKIPPPEAKPPVQTPEQHVAAPVSPVSAVSEPGMGSGRDGSAGNGPGSGGGVGSGEGTGRGSGVGPGTGGGVAANFPPSPKELFLPPMPAPSSVKGTKTLAEFDIDSTGKVLSVKFEETRDGGYNRRLETVLRSMKFKPGTRPDGTPLRMKYQMGIEF